MALIAIDWTPCQVTWTTDGDTVNTAPSLTSLIARLGCPHAAIFDASEFDDRPEVRRELATTLAASKHRLIPVRAGAAAVLDAAAGEVAASPSVAWLFAIVAGGLTRLDRHCVSGQAWRDVRQTLDLVHSIDRVHDTERVLALAVDAMGPYAGLDPATQTALGNGRQYRVDVLLAIYRAATLASDRSTFDRLLGLHGAAPQRGVTRTIREWYLARNAWAEFEDAPMLGRDEYRRALRSAFHRVKAARMNTEVAA